MRELFRKIPDLISRKRRGVENTIASQPSPFVLRQEGKAGRRLGIDEKIPLDPGSCDPKEPKYSKITSLLISSESTHLILHTEDGLKGYSQGEWGYVDTRHFKTKKQGWTNSYTESALHSRDRKIYLNGSSVYLDDEKRQLHGPGWVLEYRPLEGSS